MKHKTSRHTQTTHMKHTKIIKTHPSHRGHSLLVSSQQSLASRQHDQNDKNAPNTKHKTQNTHHTPQTAHEKPTVQNTLRHKIQIKYPTESKKVQTWELFTRGTDATAFSLPANKASRRGNMIAGGRKQLRARGEVARFLASPVYLPPLFGDRSRGVGGGSGLQVG